MAEKLDIFQAITRRMEWLGQRQGVLAQNVANSDTPGYRPQDLKDGPFGDVLARRLAPVEPAATHPAHIEVSTGGGASRADSENQRESFETAPSGNAVVLEEQLINVAETQMAYQTMSNLYRKHMDMLRAALGRGR